jgi:hypothetical protein
VAVVDAVDQVRVAVGELPVAAALDVVAAVPEAPGVVVTAEAAAAMAAVVTVVAAATRRPARAVRTSSKT